MFKHELFEQLVAHWENLRAYVETRWQEYAQRPAGTKLQSLALLLFLVAIVIGARHRRK